MPAEVRAIPAGDVAGAVRRLFIEANVELGEDVISALRRARDGEADEGPRSILDMLIENADVARRERLPICQDTGLATVYVELGEGARVDGNLYEAIHRGVREGFREGHFRASVVSDPIRRENTRDNTPAQVHLTLAPGDRLRLDVMPKGFGSENMGAIAMLNPSDGLAGALDFIVETVRRAGSNPCPPVIVGVGVGGAMDTAAAAAKRALLREVGAPNPDPFWADVEREAHRRINELGIGPAGFGGKTTALAVHVTALPTHIAGLPVAVSLSCHALRRKSAIL